MPYAIYRGSFSLFVSPMGRTGLGGKITLLAKSKNLNAFTSTINLILLVLSYVHHTYISIQY
jgi:hypothetical protein